MNKTININLGGFFFHIDESAYQKLKRYLDAIARSLNDDPQGKNEIIADIEARISELLSEKITDSRQVVNEKDIEEVIAIMGQPEDYVEAGESTNNNNHQKNTTSKKLFRDGEDKFLGGVCAGLGHYIGIDVIWIRLLLLILVFAGFGTGILLYIILWILLPEAKTSVEKLQMEGTPVNIDNIEKKIRDEFENLSTKVKDGANELSNKISSADYTKLKQQSKSGFQDFLDTIGKIALVFFKILGKFIGVLLLFLAASVLIALLVAAFSIGSAEILNNSNQFIHYPPFFYDSILPRWLLTLALFLLIGVPFVILFVLGLRILSNNVKQFSKTTSLTLLGLWLISLCVISFSGIEFATGNTYNGIKIEKNNLPLINKDTLKIKVINNNQLSYQHALKRRNNKEEVNVDGVKMNYSNYVKINIKKSETDNTYIEIEKKSEGRNKSKANTNATKISYNYLLQNNVLTFNGYFLSPYKNSWKNQAIKATLYLPKDLTVYFDNSSKHFLYNIENQQQIADKDMANHYFLMSSKGLTCTDCHKDMKKEIKEKDEEENTSKNKKSFKMKVDDNGIDIAF